MGCTWCSTQGFWVCEPGNPNPSGVCQMTVNITTGWLYKGRWRIDDGKWRIWCRGSDVAISSCEPLRQNGGPWSLAGCIDFEKDADYDVYWHGGLNSDIKIVPVGGDCGECDPDDQRAAEAAQAEKMRKEREVELAKARDS